MKGFSLVIVTTAIVWAAVLFSIDMVLEGKPYGGRVIRLVGGGAAARIIILGGYRKRLSAFEQQSKSITGKSTSG